MCSRLTDRAPSARQSSPCCLEVYTWLLHTDSPAERPSPAKPHVKQRRTRKRSHTPSLDIAQSHRSNYFGWMLQGADLYSELVSLFFLVCFACVVACCSFCVFCFL